MDSIARSSSQAVWQPATAANRELLVSLQLVRKRELTKNYRMRRPSRPRHARRSLRSTVGLRDLEPYGFMNVQMPWIELDVVTTTQGQTVTPPNAA